MINQTLSFGIFMLVENIIILSLIFDLARRTGLKIWKTRHPHVEWQNGKILLAFLLCIFIYNLTECYSCFVNYIVSIDPISSDKVVSRVFGRSIMLVSKILLWHYTVREGFNLFRGKKK